jgi:hypothetical protein
MRRHVVEPVPGVSMTDKSVLEPAWQNDDPAQAPQHRGRPSIRALRRAALRTAHDRADDCAD